jgi:hypothetical protein
VEIKSKFAKTPAAQRLATRLWSPGTEISSHGGSLLADDLIFFAKPPLEIGTVKSANSNLSETETCINQKYYVFLLIILAAATFIVACIGMSNGIAMVLMFCFLILIWTVYERRSDYIKTNTFIGNEGVARITHSGLGVPGQHEIILFKDMSHVKVRLRDCFVNGGYVRTEYTVTFFSRHNDRAKFYIFGSHSCGTAEPSLNHDYWFGQSAQSAWNDFKIRELFKNGEETGLIKFPINQTSSISVGIDTIGIDINGKRELIDRDQIERIHVISGYIKFVRRRRVQTKWWMRNQNCKFELASIGNSGLLLTLLHYWDYKLEVTPTG